MKEIIRTNGSEGFVNLKFVKNISILIDDKQREYIFINDISRIAGRKNIYGINKATSMLILSSSISYSKLSQLYFDCYFDYNKKLKKLYKDFDILQQKPIHKRRGINTIRRDIKLLHMNRENNSKNFPLDDFIGLLITSNCPEKYYTTTTTITKGRWKEEEKTKVRLNINILTINTKAISYIENLKDIGRIVLSKQQEAMVYSLKDLYSIKSNITFDEYIEDWIERLTKRDNGI